MGPERVFGHIFTDVPSSKCQPQHGGQRSIVEYNANLRQIKLTKNIKSNMRSFSKITPMVTVHTDEAASERWSFFCGPFAFVTSYGR